MSYYYKKGQGPQEKEDLSGEHMTKECYYQKDKVVED